MQIYIGNLSPDVTDEALRAMFEKYGKVRRATIGMNKEGKSEGYGFVEMPVRSEARDAVEALRGE